MAGSMFVPSHFRDGFEDFNELVVPILQQRGLFRTRHAGPMLRDQLGLSRPASRF